MGVLPLIAGNALCIYIVKQFYLFVNYKQKRTIYQGDKWFGLCAVGVVKSFKAEHLYSARSTIFAK